MNDYRNDICIIDETLVKKCIAQDFNSGLLYFELDEDNQELDSGYCNVPSFSLSEGRVRKMNEEEIEYYSLYGTLKEPNRDEPN